MSASDADVDMDKEGLYARMNTSYERIETTLADLTTKQWLTPRELGAWSARDVVAHLTTCLDQLVAEVDAAASDKAPKASIADLSAAEVETMNAESFAAHREDAPEQTLGAFRLAYGRLLDTLRPMRWADLAAVGRFAWLGDRPLWRVVAEYTWEHFDDHLPDIEWARSVPKE